MLVYRSEFLLACQKEADLQGMPQTKRLLKNYIKEHFLERHFKLENGLRCDLQAWAVNEPHPPPPPPNKKKTKKKNLRCLLCKITNCAGCVAIFLGGGTGGAHGLVTRLGHPPLATVLPPPPPLPSPNYYFYAV